MNEIQLQISEPVRNPADGQYYQRTRLVYDSDGDGVLDSVNEKIHSSDNSTTMLNPSTSNTASAMLQNFAEIAGGVATLNVRSTLHGVFKTAFRLKQLADGEIPPEEQAPFSQWPGTDEPWDPATLGSDPNPAYDPDPPPSSQDDDDGPGWFGPNGPFYFPPISRLVLDLDGDGLDIVQIEDSNAYFDLDEDGFAEKTAWIGADDGFLARSSGDMIRISGAPATRYPSHKPS